MHEFYFYIDSHVLHTTINYSENVSNSTGISYVYYTLINVEDLHDKHIIIIIIIRFS